MAIFFVDMKQIIHTNRAWEKRRNDEMNFVISLSKERPQEALSSATTLSKVFYPPSKKRSFLNRKTLLSLGTILYF